MSVEIVTIRRSSDAHPSLPPRAGEGYRTGQRLLLLPPCREKVRMRELCREQDLGGWICACGAAPSPRPSPRKRGEGGVVLRHVRYPAARGGGGVCCTRLPEIEAIVLRRSPKEPSQSEHIQHCGVALFLDLRRVDERTPPGCVETGGNGEVLLAVDLERHRRSVEAGAQIELP